MINPFTKAYCDITAIDSFLMMISIIGMLFLVVLLVAVYETYIKK